MSRDILNYYCIAESPIKPDLECFQRWGISTSLGNLFLYEKQELNAYFWATETVRLFSVSCELVKM